MTKQLDSNYGMGNLCDLTGRVKKLLTAGKNVYSRVERFKNYIVTVARNGSESLCYPMY